MSNPLFQALQLLKELPSIITGINATKYLSAAGFVILLYDHLLLLEEEVDLIWAARWGWLKILFFFNRYTVPAFIGLTTYVISGLSHDGLSTQFCQDWIVAVTFLNVITLGITNIFVVQRVWALWGGSSTILTVCSILLTITYIGAFIAFGFAVKHVIPDVQYNPVLKSCVALKRQPLYTIGYAIPIVFEAILFGLISWNALNRPRHMQTRLVQQLYVDGFIYFFGLTSLRIFNIIIISVAPLQYILLGAFFIWAMITATTNRMIVTISSNVGIAPASSHPTQEQQLTYNEMDPQFHTQGLTTLTLSEPSSPQTLMEMTPVSSKWKRPGSISTKKTKSSKEGLLSPSTKAYGQSPGHSPGYPPSPYSASKEPRSHHSPRSPSAFPAPSMRSNFMDLEEAPTIAQRQAQWQRGGRSPASDSNRTYI